MTFTLDAIMSALSEAFQRAGSRTSRDARVEKHLRDILSARTGRGKANETGREVAERRKT